MSDPPLPGPVSVEVKQGSSQYWLALLADNTGNPLASVQVQTSSGWLSLARASYNYWIAQSGSGPGPFTVRLTDTQGHQATVSGITLSPGAVQPTGTWMYGGGSDPEPASPRRRAPATAASAAVASPSRTASPARPAPPDSASLTPGTAATGHARGRPAAGAARVVTGSLGAVQLLSSPGSGPPRARPGRRARHAAATGVLT